jgi:hypothetical protein
MSPSATQTLETALGSVPFTYKSASGRAEFITRDPLGFVDGPNMYSYVVDNPWTHFDPEGLQLFPALLSPMEEVVPLEPLVRPAVESGGVPRTIQGGPMDGAPAPTGWTGPPLTPPVPVTTPLPNPTKSDRDTKTDNGNQPDIVWRGGPNNNTTFTPRPDKDTDPNDPKKGLSTFVDPAKAARNPGDQAWAIDLNKIDRSKFNVNRDKDGHVSIVPKTQAELDAWAKSRPTAKENPHPYTQDVRSAQTGEKYVKPKDSPAPQAPQKPTSPPPPPPPSN